VHRALRESGRAASAGRRQGAARGALVVAEVAVTIVLLVGAGLLLRSFARLVDVEPGFDPKGVLTLNVSLPAAKYPDDATVDAFYRDALERVAAIPGVEASGGVDPLPLSNSNMTTTVVVLGRPAPPSAERPEVPYHFATPGYFEAMHIPVLAGRAISARDDLQAPQVAVVSEALARRFWPDGNAVGQRVAMPDADQDPADAPQIEVVGVVGNVHHEALDVDAKPELYLSHAQQAGRFLTLAVRSSLPPSQLLGSVREAVRAVDPDQPIFEVKTMEQRVAESVAKRRFAMMLAAAFAAAALLLAGVGLYGVLAYFVERSEREIGVRMALGARRADVLRLVVGRGLSYAAVGLALGSLAAAAGSRVIASQLFGVSPVDLVTYASIDALVVVVALAATLIPALRATGVDPAVALRSE
jgi:putative ABC transport system permease protein